MIIMPNGTIKKTIYAIYWPLTHAHITCHKSNLKKVTLLLHTSRRNALLVLEKVLRIILGFNFHQPL